MIEEWRHQHFIHMPQSAELSADSGRMVTEYQARFLGHSSTAAQKLGKAPENCRRPEVKMTGMTAFRSDIMPHDVTRRVPKIAEAHHVPPEGAVKHTSTYVHDYKAYSIQQNTVTKTIEYSPPSAKMDVRSTYKEEFQSRATPFQRPVRTNSDLKLSHKSHMTVPYQEHCCSKAAPAAGKSWKVTPAGEKALPFESTTSYKLHYICHPPQPKRLIQRLVYKPSSSPLNCVTTYRHDYSCLQVEVVKPVRSKATWESNPTLCQGCTKLWDKCKTWPLRLTCGHRTGDSSPKDEVEFISTTHADFVVQQGHPLPSTHTPKKAWTTDKVSLEAPSAKGEKRRFWETKKVLPITQLKEPDKLVEVLTNTITCPSQDMPKTLVLPLSFQSRNCSMPGNMASTASDITKETQPCSERGYRLARGEGNKLQHTPSARESSAVRTAETNSRKPKCSHGPKTVHSAALTRRKRAN
ncbi:stabilizer of axonemal microtubules 1-like isoform X2 [Anguilla anguilla]|uniref:stabilizer of axonemal microtubules 1-like isoform X2 n=1 Tax=Anguilla anguilla TaxID=7936 RepID=UPI0015B1F6A2|nr:stabilizer of axonemal microtubules 1-like isoform X2 [Anguilla anguilla]